MRVKQDTRLNQDPLSALMAMRRELNKIYDNPRVLTESGQVFATDFTIWIDASDENVMAVLPTYSDVVGIVLVVLCVDSTNQATVAGVNLDGGTSIRLLDGEGLILKANADGWEALYCRRRERKLAYVVQDDEPTLTEDHDVIIWEDSDDTYRTYLVYKRTPGDQVKVELT